MEAIKKKSALRVPAKAGIWNIISGLVSRGVGVVGTPIFTRLLTPDEYGLYPLYATWIAVIGALITSGLAGGAVYRGLQRFGSEREKFISATTGLGITLSAALLILGFLLRDTVSALTGLSKPVLLLLITEVALGGIVSYRSALLRYEYKYRALALLNIGVAIATPLFSVGFVFFTPYHSEARILGSLTATAIVGLPTLVRAAKRAPLFDLEVWKYLTRVCIPLLPHYLASSLILRASEMVVGRTHGEAALAKYSVGISVGLALTFLTNALSQVLSPWIMRKVAEGARERIRALLELALKILLAVSLLIMSVAPEILSVITPPEYKDALPVVYPLALTVPAMFLSNMIMSAEVYYERSAKSSIPTMLTAALSLGAAALILPRIDFRFSALFTLASYLLLLLLSSFVFTKIAGYGIINPKKCLYLFAICALYGSALFLLRDTFIARFVLVLPLLPMLIVLGRRAYNDIKE